MDSQSQSMPSERASPVTTLLPGVLKHIFLFCLPENPLDHVQPDTKIAPMLLCHVSSAWRATALGFPALWLYLNHRPHLFWNDGIPMTENPGRLLEDAEFLMWWLKNNDGPFVRFRFHEPEEGGTSVSRSISCYRIPDLSFFVTYVSFARYLDVEILTEYLFRSNGRNNLFQLQYLVTHHPNDYGTQNYLNVFMSRPTLIAFHIPATLHHLCLVDVEFYKDFLTMVSTSILTHLTLHDTAASYPAVWYSLIRGLPNLQWGYFDVFVAFFSHQNDNLPNEHTLPFLSTLTVKVVDKFDANVNALALFLANLRFPALRDLSIYLDVRPWDSLQLVADVTGVLLSAPAVTKLTLGLQPIGPSNFDEELDCDTITCLSKSAPYLTHLVLDMRLTPDPRAEVDEEDDEVQEVELVDVLKGWEEILYDGCWVDFEDPACAIKKVTVVVEAPLEERAAVEEAIFGAFVPDEEENMPDVVLEIIQEDTEGFAPYSQRWKNWGMAL